MYMYSVLGCISLGKILIRILNPKTDFLFLWQNPKRDYINPMNPCVMKIQWINPNRDSYIGFTTFVFLWERI